MNVYVVVLSLASFSALDSFAKGSPPPGDPAFDHIGIDNLHVVSDGFFRGARPSERSLALLKDEGVQIVLSLEDDEKIIEQEAEWSRRQGLSHRWFELDPMKTPSDVTVNGALDILKNSDNRSVFLHCHYGRDRTGLLAALYRVEFEGWQAQRAYDEWVQRGFRTSLYRLKNYFERRTNSRVKLRSEREPFDELEFGPSF